jgi:signal transduction histidine kinase/limonene-1,2-epoxide hydrolase
MFRLWPIVARSYEVFNARDFDAYRELLHEDVELVMSGMVVHGLAAVTDFVKETTDARPGLRIDHERVFAEAGERIVTEVRMTDTATDPAAGDGARATSACGLYRVTEGRIAEWRVYHDPFAEDLASAALMALAAEQSALRRVAELVAREHSPEDLFATVAQELGVLLAVDAAAILRYDPDASATPVAGWSAGAVNIPLGVRLSLEGENLASQVKRSGRAQRKEDYVEAEGEIASTVREQGIRSAVASPITVQGETWGVIAVLSCHPEPLLPDTEIRLAEFSRHAAVAVANAKSRTDLAQSRARIVRAGDEARRRFERDLHDGAQQRLVSLGLQLRSAESMAAPELEELRRLLADVGAGLRDVLDDLRELSRGLHPAALTEAGLGPALRSLSRRSAVPVDLQLELGPERLPEPVEVAAYYVVSEALANTIKHADATQVRVSVGREDDLLELTVADDGCGGANPSNGSGLIGLADRLESLGGSVRIDSPPGAGTTVSARLPTALSD